MHKKIWLKKANSFKQAEELDNAYYRQESHEERLRDVWLCRQMYFLLKGINLDESRRRLRRVLRLFNKNKVKYCVIGAFAVGLYGYPRYSKDIDVLVEPTPENAAKIVKALREFGFSQLGLTEKDFSQKNQVIQLGYEPVRIDILTSIEGFSFDKIWKGKTKAKFGSEEAFFIGKKELIASKKKANRAQDHIDLKKIAARGS